MILWQANDTRLLTAVYCKEGRSLTVKIIHQYAILFLRQRYDKESLQKHRLKRVYDLLE